MNKVLLISDNKSNIKNIMDFLEENALQITVSSDEEEVFHSIQNSEIDIVIADLTTKNINVNNVCRRIKIQAQTKNIQTILIYEKDKLDYEILKYANSYIQEPVDKEILLASINSGLQVKNALAKLSENNIDLCKSLYQLNVLYNTSTQLAGSLDKNNLVDIMLDGLEKSLSFSICYSLIYNNENDITLLINSLHPISERLEDAIKLRAVLSYKTLFSMNPDIASIKVKKNIKHQFAEYDLNVFTFDNLFAPINIKDKFFGIIEVFRSNDFSQEDTTCFQTLVKQASLPLESAILYEEIKETNIKLERLERLKSEFISIVSHELRTPLTAIKNSLEILLSGKTGALTAQMDKFLNMAKRNVTRLSAIINDLLDLSKIEAGKMDFRFELSNINTPTEFIKNTFDTLAKDKNIELILNLGKNLEPVYVDSQRIEQVLTNLVSNAVKFTPENGKIVISTSKITKNEVAETDFFEEKPKNLFKEYIKISVQDSGIGIAEEDRHKVFDKFQQIENSLSRKVGGTGLGLPIAKQLVETHKGFIWLDGEPNHGSTFTIAIPVMSEEDIFVVNLAQNIQKAKQNHSSIGIIAIKERLSGAVSFVDRIIEENIVQKSATSLSLKNTDGEFKYFYFNTLELEPHVIEFYKKKFEGYIKLSGNEFKNCDILYSTAIFPNDALTAEELIKKAKLSFKEVCYEKDSNS